jgi:lysophospholipase L1-like esterase
MKLIKNLTYSAKVLASAALMFSLIACGGNDYVNSADRNDVVTLGDSIFDLSGDIQANLEAQAGQTFRNYTQSGAEISGGLIARSVENQYADAKASNPNIDIAVMNGGGNDLLIPAILLDPYGCRTHWWRWSISRSCRNLVNDTYVKAVNLLNTMGNEGVDDIIFLGYYELPRGNANLKSALNYGDDRLRDACNNSSSNCTFLDPRGMVPASHVLSDNIHPTAAGSKTLSDLIWPVLNTIL